MLRIAFLLLFCAALLNAQGPDGFGGSRRRRPWGRPPWGGGNGVPRWCPPGSPRIRCFVNPCQVLTCPAFPWARCINDNPCERACSGNFYIGRWRISQQRCNSRRRI